MTPDGGIGPAPIAVAPEGSFDAIVIGSGAGGATLALRLCQHGMKVLLVERGGHLETARGDAAAATGRFIDDVRRPRGASVSCVGGQTKFYGAALYRMRASDFRETAHECGISPAWPMSYADLEPYYTQAERLYRVHGAAGSDPSDPPRHGPFPYPPLPHAPIVSDLVRRLERSGTRVCAIPRGIDLQPGGRCVLCAGCDAHHCRIDAKMDAEIAAIRPALATGRLTLATLTECLRVLVDTTGRQVVGAVLGCRGATTTVRAGIVAVCAGIPGTAMLLRRSRTAGHPGGLGNAGGALGRYLGGHSAGMIFPFVPGGTIPELHSKTFAINSFYDGSPGWPFPTGVIQAAGQMPFWRKVSPCLRPIARFVGMHSLMCFYMTEALPTAGSGLVFDGDRVHARIAPVTNHATFRRLRRLAMQAFRQAGYRVLARRQSPYLWHEIGTARCGHDPGSSVVDPDLQVHGTRGLYVVDASVLPSAGAVNTGLTIMALALRAGDHIGRARQRAHAGAESGSAA